ncbi:LPS export ABC transporter permease LptG [Caulobacter mirabilis]|uniref:LPS export ABC transporter permease LptG n=1 Tax=Caulobacter mirabilis TaxID=69666 RepID=A0A2D2AYZ9_9CAUL|nr:LPS export ABC transporter permease LptG [Caulobacter mirabilis]ATQ43243.1 LPS export ABC transporter permease LptG [Caulobacter mirabilis]
MSLGIGRLERYVLARTLTGVAGALAVIGAVILLIDFVEVSRTVGGRGDAGFPRLLWLTLLKAPSTILTLLPFAFLFGTLAAFVGLNRRSELIAMRAAGVSAWRFILPAAAAAFVVGATTVAALNPLAAVLGAQFERSRDAVLEEFQTSKPKDTWLRQGDASSQVVIRAQSHDETDGTVRLKNVSMFVYRVNSSGGLEFSRRIEAEEARLMPGYWRLRGVREAAPGAGAVRSETLSIPSTLDEQAALERFTTPNAIAFWRLPATIRGAESAGFSALPYRLRLHQLLATPLLFAAMSVLAAAFSLRLMRLGGLAALAGSGVALGFVFFFFNQFSGALGKAEIIPAFAAAWAPPLLALLSGLTLLCYTEDGGIVRRRVAGRMKA